MGNLLYVFTEMFLKVGQVVFISESTDDYDLIDYIKEHGDKVIITEVEYDGDELTGNFWGVSESGEPIPYHLEWRDVYAAEGVETLETSP